jgi:hypothetical protein
MHKPGLTPIVGHAKNGIRVWSPHAYLLENGRHKEEIASLMAGIADRGVLRVLFHPDIGSRV